MPSIRDILLSIACPDEERTRKAAKSRRIDFMWIAVVTQLVALAGQPSLAVSAEHENPVFASLVVRGVPFRGERFVPLSEPTLPDGLGEQEQRQAIASIASLNHPIEQLLRPSIVSPFVLKIHKVRVPKSDRPARRIDVWFVAYGDLALLGDQEFLRDLARQSEDRKGSKLPTEMIFLEDDELLKRSLVPNEAATVREVWFHSTFSLFDRLQLHVTRHAYVTRTRESVLVASILDGRFADDPKYPTAWNALTRDQLGQFQFGEKQPYQSAGFYLKATRLRDPHGAMFVEYHQVFDEPEAWFDGANLLRSKLPLMVQDGVRKFRRKLRRANAE